jgi:hypothetical protein
LPSTTTAPEDIQAVLEALNTERIQVIGDGEAAIGELGSIIGLLFA